jgi:hypothetical protein
VWLKLTALRIAEGCLVMFGMKDSSG